LNAFGRRRDRTLILCRPDDFALSWLRDAVLAAVARAIEQRHGRERVRALRIDHREFEIAIVGRGRYGLLRL